MIPIIENIEEAMEFFLQNSSGICICKKENNEELEVDCYPQAVEFFKD